jgi:hypothetical protein
MSRSDDFWWWLQELLGECGEATFPADDTFPDFQIHLPFKKVS